MLSTVTNTIFALSNPGLAEFAQMMADMRAFKEADARRVGTLNLMELKSALGSLGVDLNTDLASRRFAELAGEVALVEFAPIVRELKAA